MKEEGLFALFRSVFSVARTAALDLDAAAGLLLDVFDILPTVAHNRSPEVEARDWLQVNKDLLFGPFTLLNVSVKCSRFRNPSSLCQTRPAQRAPGAPAV